MKSMKRILSALTLLTLFGGLATIPTACGDNAETTKIKLDDIDLGDIEGFASEPSKLTTEDVALLIDNIDNNLLSKIKEKVPKAEPDTDYITNAKDAIKVDQDVSSGVTVTVTAKKESKLLSGSKTFKVVVHQA